MGQTASRGKGVHVESLIISALVFGVFFVVSCDALVNTCVMDPASTANVMADLRLSDAAVHGDSLDCNQNATNSCDERQRRRDQLRLHADTSVPRPPRVRPRAAMASAASRPAARATKTATAPPRTAARRSRSRDASNCACPGDVCPGGANATGACIQGKCQLSCQGLFLDCNGDATDGCEVNGASDGGNCGRLRQQVPDQHDLEYRVLGR